MDRQSFIRLALVTLVHSTLLALVLGFSETLESTGASSGVNALSTTALSMALEISPLECQACGPRQARYGWDDRAGDPCSVLKIDPALAGDTTCAPVEAKDGALGLQDLCAMKLAEPRSEKRVSVASLVDQALKDQVPFLQARAGELERWSPADQARFALWFGTTDERARVMIHQRLTVLAKINEAYTFKNFRRARHRPGVFAYVHPTDPSRIFVDLEFVKARRTGANSRLGTVTHEMSHFVIAGGTKDHAYGTDKCKALARSNPGLALTNADNFEFYVEGAR